MSAFAPTASSGSAAPSEFELQRSELLREIALGMESVLQNINRLNRNLESIIAVGNEFGSVEALWSHFENFMDADETQQQTDEKEEEEDTQAAENEETVTEDN
ncbi:DASH complex subunit Dad1-domain-containing protein [Talaromyces proteolyticus]|uniref:DASH complex subunit DAD1 n=1 Tax=Talaromyces proteolyticus TaxID=1131652 RepID=A0AAD4KQ32_9EURO|nr:DASH complex subunit Dad1-domain-containing protein [Talaromyces proteolyticus]KAH8696601.1 DASH complex subunit Dad1-domain-containing protein [Talaromyces proteolyticus]